MPNLSALVWRICATNRLVGTPSNYLLLADFLAATEERRRFSPLRVVIIVSDEMFQHRGLPPGHETEAIEFSEKDRADAARLLMLIAGEGHAARAGLRHPATVARSILEDRRRRSLIFNRGMFGEPAWELLLTLYVMDREGPRLTVGRLAKIAGCALTTTLRWLDYLRDQQLVFRQEKPGDARTEFVRLTDKARGALELYLSEVSAPRL